MPPTRGDAAAAGAAGAGAAGAAGADAGCAYTHDDLRAVVAFARDRGVRVVPEIDTPGRARGPRARPASS